jgi:NadR type nicotinamide-nucleotide adenylyltransferase
MKKIVRIVITGPESTAKSTLTMELSEYFNGTSYPEYAREYFKNQPENYTFEDIEYIARKQIGQYHDSENQVSGMVFFDTWLIITKVWFQWAYQTYPTWLDDEITNLPMDLYLLCLPDIPWVPDPLREHGGEERVKLFEAYKKELTNRNLNFIEVGGEGEERIQNAIQAVKDGLARIGITEKLQNKKQD